MTASDLRIGNYLTDYKDGILLSVARIEAIEYTEWNSGDDFNVTALEYGTKERYLEGEFEPIPLTEEWLLKFGFDHHYDLGKRKFMNIKTLTIETNSSENFPVYYTTQKIIICYIKYVHQLQNLYFALTGEELILNI